MPDKFFLACLFLFAVLFISKAFSEEMHFMNLSLYAFSFKIYQARSMFLRISKLKGLFSLQNLLANPKCSLLVAKDPEDRTDLVITLYGDAISVCSFIIFSFIILHWFYSMGSNEDL